LLPGRKLADLGAAERKRHLARVVGGGEIMSLSHYNSSREDCSDVIRLVLAARYVLDLIKRALLLKQE